jgi:DNA-directed RNA polymerase subunit RPC12/RpoP
LIKIAEGVYQPYHNNKRVWATLCAQCKKGVWHTLDEIKTKTSEWGTIKCPSCTNAILINLKTLDRVLAQY